jgi:hypothetical protein
MKSVSPVLRSLSSEGKEKKTATNDIHVTLQDILKPFKSIP